MFDMVRIGKRIAELRKQNNMTQLALADAMGISFQAVSNWERGNSMPDISKLPELAELLGTTVDALIGQGNPLILRAAAGERIDLRGADGEQLAELALLSRPHEVETYAQEVAPNALAGILPYLSAGAVGKLAEQYAAPVGPEIFLPYLETEKLDELMLRRYAEGGDVSVYLPYASPQAIARLAEEYEKKGDGVGELLAFAATDALLPAAARALKRGGAEALRPYLPYLSERDIHRLILDSPKEE